MGLVNVFNGQPEQPSELEVTRQVAATAIRIGEKLLAENAELKRQLAGHKRRGNAPP